MTAAANRLAHEAPYRVATRRDLDIRRPALAGPKPIGGYTKRVFDLAFVVIALPVLLPGVVLIALAVRLSGAGPVLFAHTRVGYAGRPFRCFKFRTMVEDAEKVLSRHLEENPTAALEWETTRKLRHDPRITRVGRILRALSLDEFAQIWNVVRGEMSLVGPRPVVADELSLYGSDAALYLRARPGLTGLWQVSGRNDVSYRQRVTLDRRYVERWSFWADLAIILRTIPAVLASRGSY